MIPKPESVSYTGHDKFEYNVIPVERGITLSLYYYFKIVFLFAVAFDNFEINSCIFAAFVAFASLNYCIV